MNIEIDNGSGFCFGVTTAIEKAEQELAEGTQLYCLGDIVHNGIECERLLHRGLKTIDHDELLSLHDTKVLLRAHGEPPRTYEIAKQNNVEIVDATCPVVLALQRRIRRQYINSPEAQIVIFGKKGHAEVLGLVGQTEGNAIIIEHYSEIDRSPIDYSKDIYLYSQTTKSLDEYQQIIAYINNHKSSETIFKSHDTICRQVANRMANIQAFAKQHNVVLFVSGKKSSNGKVLFNECLKVNPRSYHIEGPEEILTDWFSHQDNIGICGATSTPKWLMEDVKKHLEEILGTPRKH